MSHSDSVKITHWNSGLQLLCHSRGLVVVLVLVGIRSVQLELKTLEILVLELGRSVGAMPSQLLSFSFLPIH